MGGLLSKIKWGSKLLDIVGRVAQVMPNEMPSLTGLRNRVADMIATEVRRGALDDLIVKSVRARGIIVDYVEKG